MLRRQTFALSIHALALIGGSAHAAGPVGQDTDILGIKLSMSRDQVRKLVSQSFPGAKIADLPVALGTSEYSKATTAGFVANITSAEDQAGNQRAAEQAKKEFEARQAGGFGNSPLNQSVSSVGDVGNEKLLVLFNPNENTTDIFAVSRYKEFSKTNFPVTKVLLDSLIDKYGQPSASVYGTSFTWMAPGVYEKTKNARGFSCVGNDEGVTFLYESAKIASPDFIGLGFIAAVRAFNDERRTPKYANIAKCGTILQVDLRLSNDKAYVTTMSERLINVAKADAELSAFGADFLRQADAAKQGKLLRDSQNKPKL